MLRKKLSFRDQMLMELWPHSQQHMYIFILVKITLL